MGGQNSVKTLPVLPSGLQSAALQVKTRRDEASTSSGQRQRVPVVYNSKGTQMLTQTCAASELVQLVSFCAFLLSLSQHPFPITLHSP